MQPLTTYDLVLNIFVVVIMPLLIVANLKGWGTQSPLNIYLWRESPNLMRVSLVILGLLALYSLVQLAGYFGLISPSVRRLRAPRHRHPVPHSGDRGDLAGRQGHLPVHADPA